MTQEEQDKADAERYRLLKRRYGHRGPGYGNWYISSGYFQGDTLDAGIDHALKYDPNPCPPSPA